MAGYPWVDKKLVLVDQIKPVQICRQFAATEQYRIRGRVLEFLYLGAQIPDDVVAVGPGKVLSRRRHHIFRLGLQLDRPLANRWRCINVSASDPWLLVPTEN